MNTSCVCMWVWVLIVGLLPLGGNAAEYGPEHRQTAEALFETMHMERMLADTIDRVLETQLASNPALAPYRDVMKKFFSRYMSAESLKEDLVDLYMETFTAQELSEMVAFYSTDTGQKALLKAPEQIARGAALGQRRVQDHIDELKQMIEDESKRIQELQKDAAR